MYACRAARAFVHAYVVLRRVVAVCDPPPKKTLIPKIAEGIFNVICKFNATNEYVLYYHSGRKTLRVFRVKDATMISNFRVPSDLSSLESTTDGISVVLGKRKIFTSTYF